MIETQSSLLLLKVLASPEEEFMEVLNVFLSLVYCIKLFIFLSISTFSPSACNLNC